MPTPPAQLHGLCPAWPPSPPEGTEGGPAERPPRLLSSTGSARPGLRHLRRAQREALQSAHPACSAPQALPGLASVTSPLTHHKHVALGTILLHHVPGLP